MEEYFVEEKTSVDRLLDFLVFVGVFLVTIFLLLDVFAEKAGLDLKNLSNIYFYVNILVFIIFFADLVRLWVESENAKSFWKNNWLDVLATIPFGLIASASASFGILKWAKLSKLSAATKLQKASKISKISKEFKAASHLKKEGEEYNKKHRL